jgi:ArsR family transcriptional regulator
MDKKRPEHAPKASEALAPLSLPTRLLILCLLLDRERFVGELVEELGPTKGNISQHLRVLENQGHIVSRKEANRVFYRVGDRRLLELIGILQKLYGPGLPVHQGPLLPSPGRYARRDSNANKPGPPWSGLVCSPFSLA